MKIVKKMTNLLIKPRTIQTVDDIEKLIEEVKLREETNDYKLEESFKIDLPDIHQTEYNYIEPLENLSTVEFENGCFYIGQMKEGIKEGLGRQNGLMVGNMKAIALEQ